MYLSNQSRLEKEFDEASRITILFEFTARMITEPKHVNIIAIYCKDRTWYYY